MSGQQRCFKGFAHMRLLETHAWPTYLIAGQGVTKTGSTTYAHSFRTKICVLLVLDFRLVRNLNGPTADFLVILTSDVRVPVYDDNFITFTLKAPFSNNQRSGLCQGA